MQKFLFFVFFSVAFIACDDSFEAKIADQAAQEQLAKLSDSAKANISDHESALSDATEMLRIAQEINSHKHIGEAYNIIGVINRQQDNYVAALQNFSKSTTSFEMAGDTAGLAKVYNNIGNIYRDISKYDEAILFYQKSLTAKTLLRDKEGMAITNRNMAFVYQLMEEYQKAKDSYWTALYTWKTLGQEERMAQIYNDLGIVYELMADQESLTEDEIEQNIISNLYSNALELYQKTGNIKGMGWTYNNIAASLIERREYEEAFSYLEEALRLKGLAEDQEGLTTTYNNIGFLYLTYLRDSETAITYFKRAEKHAEGEELLKSYEYLAVALENHGLYTSAIEYIRKLNELKEDLTIDAHKQQIAQTKARTSVEYAGL